MLSATVAGPGASEGAAGLGKTDCQRSKGEVTAGSSLRRNAIFVLVAAEAGGGCSRYE